MVVTRYAAIRKVRRTLEREEAKSFLSLVCWHAAGVGLLDWP